MEWFMKGKGKQLPEEEVVVSKRFVDDKGKPIPFRIKAISTELIHQLQDECTTTKKKKGITDEKIDQKRFVARLCVETTVYPDFKNKELLNSYGLVDPVDLIKAILNIPGEYAGLIQAVQRINGFEDNFDELVEEAKN